MIQTEFFIPTNTPSSKNSRRLVSGGRFIASKQTMRWRKDTEEIMKELAPLFRKAVKKKTKPYKIGLFFIRASRRKFDALNPSQTIADAMVHHGWIDDDNTDEVVFIPIQIDNVWYKVDKENAGVIIRIL